MSKLERKIEAVNALLGTWGWKEDRFGHFHRTIQVRNESESGEVELRLKIQKTSCRFEEKAHYSDGKTFWVKKAADYFSNLIITSDEIQIGRYGLNAQGYYVKPAEIG